LSATVIKTVTPTPEERASGAMGSAEILVESWSDSFRSESLQRSLPDGSRLIALASRTRATRVVAGGSSIDVALEEFAFPVDRPPLEQMFRVTGTTPRKPNEALVHPYILEAIGLGVGDRLDLPDREASLKVTGSIVRAESLGSYLIAVGPGTLGARAQETITGYVLDIAPGVRLSSVLSALDDESAVIEYKSRFTPGAWAANDRRFATGISFAVVVFGLFGAGLVAAAAFVVGIRRRLRNLGVLGALGAESRHIAISVVFEGAALGLIGAGAGVLLGLAVAHAIHGYLDELAGRVVGSVEIPLGVAVTSVVLGAATAALAAYLPARLVALMPAVDALAGRTPARSSRNLARWAGVFVGVGGLALAAGTVADLGLVATTGALAIVVGVLLATPLLVAALGGIGNALPGTLRLAVRQTAQYGRQTSAAVAAAAVALMVPVALATLTSSEEAFERRNPKLGDDQLLMGDSLEGARSPVIEAALQDLRDEFTGAVIAPLSPAVSRSKDHSTATVTGGVKTTSDGIEYQEAAIMHVGGPDLLRAIGAEEGINHLEEGRVIAVGRGSSDDGLVQLQLPPDERGREGTRDLSAVEIPAPVYFNEMMPHYIVSPELARTHGLVPESPRVYLIRVQGGVTNDDVEGARERVARYPGLYIQSAQDFYTDASPTRMAALGASTVLALAVIAIAVALVGAESRRDQAILVAVGASPGTRRLMLGMNGFLLAGLAGLLALPAGFVPVAVFQVARQVGIPIVVPWGTFGFVAMVAPMVAGMAGALFSRQPRALAMLRPIW
jgi:putative ABC transport system permease protein